jgi:hypothetical protein
LGSSYCAIEGRACAQIALNARHAPAHNAIRAAVRSRGTGADAAVGTARGRRNFTSLIFGMRKDARRLDAGAR